MSVVTRPGDAFEAFDVLDAKRVLRARMRAVRRVIASDADERRARSDVIANRLVQLVEQRTPGPRRVMTYDALPGEVDLAVFHDWCRARRIERFAPLVDPEHRDALLVVPGPLDPGELDVVVVPGVAFTATRHRLGWGGPCCGADGTTTGDAAVTVPAAEYFVLGDNPAASRDSRRFGFVARSRIVGRVLLRVWPPGSVGGRPRLVPLAG